MGPGVGWLRPVFSVAQTGFWNGFSKHGKDPMHFEKAKSLLCISGDRRVRCLLLAVIGVNLSSLALVGCGPNDHEINAFVHDWEASTTGTEHVILPPDIIEVTSPTAPEIDHETHVVGADGKISLRLIGQVKVAGLTPVDVARKIEKLLSTYYVDPTVNVRIVKNGSKRIYVLGQVARGGQLPYTGRDTVLSVLTQAQPTFLAWKDQIKVIHPSHDGKKRHTLTVDYFKIAEQGDLSLNVILEDGDIIYVPPTPLAWVGLRIQELLFPAQPVAQTFILPGQTKVSYDTLYTDDNN